MEKKSILVLGKNGQVAQGLMELLGQQANFADQTQANFLEPRQVLDFIEAINPDIIINAAAYTAVDKAESELQQAELINFKTPASIAKWVAKNNRFMVHYSSDYVFDGYGDEPRSEADTPNPLSVYGRSKFFGDQAILQSGARCVVLRTSWVYSHTGHNFMKTMLRLGAERRELSVVEDQIGSPTYALDLAKATLDILNHPQLNALTENGGQIYNVCNQGLCSWYEFAIEIFRQAPEFGIPLVIKAIKPISTEQYPTPAKRPLNSRLSLTKLEKDFGLQMPPWKDSLSRALKALSQKR